MMKRLFFLMLLVAGAMHSVAQVTVEARIDSIEMFVGQQVHVGVKATAPSGAKVSFPAYQPQQMIAPGVEYVNATDVNVYGIDNGMSEFSKVYTLTSFDSKLYYLPPFSVDVDGKAYKSKSLALKVLSVAVDTTNMEKFFGPKDVQDNPFSWSENGWSQTFWLSVFTLLLSIIGFYLYLRLRDNKPIIAPIRMVKRLLPHQKAMMEIERIKADKMVTSENQKEYYTKLTDTIRKYIEERYGFRAMEMTSREIIDRLTARQDENALGELKLLFETADLVKFAKYSTLINENDMNLVNAVDFINSTKTDEVIEEKAKPQLSQEEVRSVRTRRALKIMIISIFTVCVCMFVYVVYSTYQQLQ